MSVVRGSKQRSCVFLGSLIGNPRFSASSSLLEAGNMASSVAIAAFGFETGRASDEYVAFVEKIKKELRESGIPLM